MIFCLFLNRCGAIQFQSSSSSHESMEFIKEVGSIFLAHQTACALKDLPFQDVGT